MKKMLSIILVTSLFLGGFFIYLSTSTVSAVDTVSADNVCPEGGDWSDHIGPNNANYNAPSGFKVIAVCIKGGSSASPNG